MTQTVALNQLNVFVTVRLITDADGTPATGVVASTGGHVIWYRRDDAVVVTDSTSAADLSALTSTHTDWEFLHIRNGYYTVALPDAAFAEGVGGVLCGMDATGISCVAEKVDISPFIKFQGLASSVTSTTTTFPSGTTPLKGDQILVAAGTGEPGDVVLITSASGEVATHAAFATGISATTTTIILIPGDSVTADGGINADVATSSRSSLATGDLNSQTATITALLPTELSTAGFLKSDIREVNGNGGLVGDGVVPIRKA